MKLTARAAGSLAVTLALPASIAAGVAPATAQHPGAATAIRTGSQASPVKAIRWGSARFIVGSVTRNLVSFDTAVKEHVDLRMLFMNWGSTAFPATVIRANTKAGAQSVLELMPRNQSLIGIGNTGNTVYNRWLHDFLAPKIAALGIPITISFASEMNGPWYSWGFGHFTPRVFVRAWRHIHDLLAGTKAGPLITWMWQPSAIHFSTPNPVRWFPGSKYVNIIGLDGYFVLPADDFDVIFGKTIRLVRALTTLPIMVGETSIGWLTGHALLDMRRLFRGIRRFHLKGLVWFNINQRGSTSIYHEDWRIQDRPWLQRSLTRQITWTEQSRNVP
jgi:glycosyl hydrolase family 26